MTSAVDSNKQAKRSAAQVEKVIQPVYPLDLDRQPIVLYAGSLTASLKGVNFGQLFDGEGMVLFRLAPEPQMPWTVVAEPVDLPVDVEEELTEGLLPPDFSALPFPDPWADHAIPDLPRQGTNYVQFGGGLRRTEIGEPDMLSELRLSLIGFPLCLGTTDVIYPDCIARPGRISFAVGDWAIDIDIWFDLDRVPFSCSREAPIFVHSNVSTSEVRGGHVLGERGRCRVPETSVIVVSFFHYGKTRRNSAASWLR